MRQWERVSVWVTLSKQGPITFKFSVLSQNSTIIGYIKVNAHNDIVNQSNKKILSEVIN